MFCPQCGKDLPDNVQFCDNCGASLTQNNTETASAHQDTKINLNKAASSDITVVNETKARDNNAAQSQQAPNDEMRKVIGNNADYYLKEFAKIEAGGKPSFNIAAFFLHLFFCLYRRCGQDIGKKYLLLPLGLNVLGAALSFIGMALISLTVMGVGGVLSMVGSIWLIVACVRLGINFNREYYQHCQTVLAEKRQAAYGVSAKNVFILIGAVVALSIVLSVISLGGLSISFDSDDDYIDEDILLLFEEIPGSVIYVPNKDSNMSAMDMYQFILDKYTTAMAEGWNIDKLGDNNLNYQLVYYDYSDIGYMLIDINNDGVQELLIGLMDYDYMGLILDLYTVADNQLIQLISADERSSYNLLKDGTVYNEASSSAFDNYAIFYRLDDKAATLKLQECFIYDESIDAENPWFYFNADSKKKIVRAEKAGFNNLPDDIINKLDCYYLDLTVFDTSAYWENAWATETTEPDAPYFLMGSDSRYIEEYELYGFNADDCRIARNEIYARHGRKFNSADLQDYFNAQSWYVPAIEADAFSDSMLNEYERANINLILAYEKAQGYR